MHLNKGRICEHIDQETDCYFILIVETGTSNRAAFFDGLGVVDRWPNLHGGSDIACLRQEELPAKIWLICYHANHVWPALLP